MKSDHPVQHFLERSAQAQPEQIFLIHEEERVSYGDLESAANRLARVLLRAGLLPGDRVGLLAENSRLYVEAYFGALKAGGIAVPLNTVTKADALAGVLRSSGTRFLISSRRHLRTASAALREGTPVEVLLRQSETGGPALPDDILTLALCEASPSESAEPPPCSVTDLDVASIVYTSGSTGTPLGATLTHGNLVSNVRSIVSYLALTPEDRVLAILPFYYVYGKSLLNTHAAAGAAVVIENGFQYPNKALDTLQAEACTGFSGVPSTFAILLNRSNFAERELPSLRYVTQAGGGMSPSLTRRLMAALPGKRIFIMYGATEAGARLSYLPPEELPRKLGSIGKAIPNVELRVLRSDNSEAEPGEEGEIVARGSNIMQGYWNDPDATADVLDEHGYHTGDLAVRDEEGFFFIVGRKADIIKAGAHRISAKEIEDAIVELPEVHEVAVIGVPDEIMGEKIRACVALRAGVEANPAALLQALKKRLPAHKVPAEILAYDDLPKNESGKIMKQVLAKEAEQSEPAESGQTVERTRSPDS